MGVIHLPIRRRRRSELTAKEKWSAGEPTDLMVWEICPYLRKKDGNGHVCFACPQWESEKRFDVPVKRGCRAVAEEGLPHDDGGAEEGDKLMKERAKTIPFNATKHFDTPEAQAHLLADAFAWKDAAYITRALNIVSSARHKALQKKDN